MARESKISVMYSALVRQYKWFDDRGGCKAAYVERYGSVDDPDHYGDGGEAIYEADVAALRQAHCAYMKASGAYNRGVKGSDAQRDRDIKAADFDKIKAQVQEIIAV